MSIFKNYFFKINFSYLKEHSEHLPSRVLKREFFSVILFFNLLFKTYDQKGRVIEMSRSFVRLQAFRKLKTPDRMLRVETNIFHCARFIYIEFFFSKLNLFISLFGRVWKK